MKQSYSIILILLLAFSFKGKAQQDPQFTQYMYNPQIINPAYAGSQEGMSFGLLYRTQWVGFEGAPRTLTFTGNSSLGTFDQMGLGLSVVTETIGPANDSNINIDYSYAINVSDNAKLGFGLKAGVSVLDVDFTKLNIFDDTDPQFQNNIDNRIQPQVGAGLFYYKENMYVGLSTPNFLSTNHFDESSLQDNEFSSSVASESIHYFLMAGYVFDIGANLKFKPATLVKVVTGSPLQWDLSANFLFKEKFTFGAAYRWSAALSALAGFQANDNIFIGVAYDYQSTDIELYSDGSYELIFRYDLFDRPERVLTPRFF